MTSVWFDFTGFPGKVAELNRLHRLVCETSELRMRTRKAEDVARWEDAVKHWKDFSGFGLEKFYLFENDRFLAALSGGEAEARACAVTFLEFDPYYYRSGYMKSKLLVRLKHLTLRESEKKRLRKIVRDAILSPRPKCEFKDYARLLKNIGTPEFRQVIRNLPVPDVPYLSARRLPADKGAVYALHRQRLVIIAAGDLPVSALLLPDLVRAVRFRLAHVFA